jgi:bacillithiol biosynthesis deacetylase BshB1
MASPLSTLPPKKRLLCVAPHPDDAELGMGGSLITFARQGHDVMIVDLTDGEPTPNGSREIRQKEWTEATRQMTQAAGVTIQRTNLGLPNRTVTHDVPSRHKLAAVFRQFRPHVVFIPYVPDAHPDHVAAHAIGRDARFDAKLTKSDIPGEPWHPKRVIQYFCTHLRTDIVPSFCVDVSEAWPAKRAACAAYASQGLAEDDGLWPYVETMHGYFGGRCGVQFAEPFRTDEVVGLRGLDELV